MDPTANVSRCIGYQKDFHLHSHCLFCQDCSLWMHHIYLWFVVGVYLSFDIFGLAG